MNIAQELASGIQRCSFEFFPPKSDEGIDRLMETIAQLQHLQPLFVSVTYGAGGSSRARTMMLAKRIKRELSIEVLVHLTGLGHTRQAIREIADDLAAAGIENILALRGDPPEGDAVAEGDFLHANELITFLAQEYQFCLGAACYPETHLEAESPEADLEAAKRKVEAGASFLITQLFFVNERYRMFVDRARAVGISVPILAGIMPITDAKQVVRFTKLCGATIPPLLLHALYTSEMRSGEVADLGVAYATLQAAALLAEQAPGLHLYTLNRSPATQAIVSALRITGALP